MCDWTLTKMSNSVLVIGAVNIDIFATSTEKYNLEDSNVAKINLGFGGVGGNIATNLNTLGLDVSFITTFSNDLLGKYLQIHYNTIGIDTSHSIETSHENSSVYLGIMDDENDLFLGLNDMEIVTLLNSEYIKKQDPYIKRFEYIVLDNNLMPETLKHVLETYQDKKLFIDGVSAKKVGKLKPYLKHITSLKVNQMELNELSNEQTIESQLNELLALGVSEVVLTNKSDPVYHATNNGINTFQPNNIETIINASGAGDAFFSGYIYGRIKKKNLASCIKEGIELASKTLQVKTSTI